MKKTATISLLLLLALPATSQEIPDKLMEHTDGTHALFPYLYENPAMQAGRYLSSLNTIGAGFDGRWATTPQLLEKGDKARFWQGDIDAYIPKEHITLWGHANYRNGSVKNIRFSETTDHELLYPYLMADTVAGNTSYQEIYDFTGGFARRIGSRWTLGGQGDYTAHLSYATRDPRPKNLTGDLRLALGATYLLNAYQIGASAHFRRYKQTNDLKFYDEVNVPVVYHLTGVGTDYYRFRGENTSTYYKGTGGGFSVSLRPEGGQGFHATAGWSVLSLDKIISTLNELPLATFSIYQQKAEAGYLKQGETAWGIRLFETWQLRRGTENIFGSPAANMYPKISEAPQYRQQDMEAGAEALLRHRQHGASYEVKGSLVWQREKATHQEAWRKLQTENLQAALQIGGNWRSRQWLFQAVGGFSYTGNLSGQMELGGNIEEAIMPPIRHRYDYLTHKHLDTRLSASAHYDTGHRYSLFAAAEWQWLSYLEAAHTHQANITIGLEF